VGVALGLDVIGLVAWCFAFFGPFPPHPWIFMLFALIGFAGGAAALALTLVGRTRNVVSFWWLVPALGLAMVPSGAILLLVGISAFSNPF